MLVPKPLILFVDAYDSFSNNIVSLLETTLDVSVRTIKIDNPALASDDALHEELRHYVAVVCGPGPGHPRTERDVGLMRRIWRLSDKELLPVLGICLGFQSLCEEFGGSVLRMNGPQHGIIRQITHIGESDHGNDGPTLRGNSIFQDVGPFTATLYQSLYAEIGQGMVSRSDWQKNKWDTYEKCPELIPLAWVEHDLSVENQSGIWDARVLVAVQHISKPFYALQYHPESICTSPETVKVLRNWFDRVMSWHKSWPKRRMSFEGPIQGKKVVRESLLAQSKQNLSKVGIFDAAPPKPKTCSDDEVVCHSLAVSIPSNASVAVIVDAVQGDYGDRIILESSNANEDHTGGTDVRGRYSIIGLEVADTLRYEYISGSNFVTVGERVDFILGRQEVDLQPYGGIWPYLAKQLDTRQVVNIFSTGLHSQSGGPGSGKESPFWGGFLGYTTYELGLEDIGVKTEQRYSTKSRRPDLCFAWITRSLVIDHILNIVYIQELCPRENIPESGVWQTRIRNLLEANLFPLECFEPGITTFSNIAKGTTKEQIEKLISSPSFSYNVKLHYDGPTFTGIATTENLLNYPTYLPGIFPLNGHIIRSQKMSPALKILAQITKKNPTPAKITGTPVIEVPNDRNYEEKVLRCQNRINSGDSYELCLTNQICITHHHLPTPTHTSWTLYKKLRTRQPAPFASYIRFGGATLVSASPERFLTYSADGKCELRPMKGTVKKSAAVSTLQQATALLDVPKEKAENLMIVDLVRHDLHGICGSGNVTVPRLMVVEEYKSVFQMISIVQGQIPPPIDLNLSPHMSSTEIAAANAGRYTGLDVLSSSLPPGSMTGAPKKRSCEILQDIEEGVPRGLYSGVVGYMDVRGGGDWSVSIRCMYKWDDEDERSMEEVVVGKQGIKEEDVVRGEDGRTMAERVVEKWYVGAGGAVTALSTATGEREEMLAKLGGTVGLFRDRSYILSLVEGFED